MTVYDDEIDLRPYILLLIHRWRWIAIIAIGMATLALLISLLLPRKYEATATLLLTRSRARLSLAEQFPTETEPLADTRSRMDALLSIAESNAIAADTLQQLGDLIPLDEREIEILKDHMTLKVKGDALLITASAKDPPLAAEIANTWASLATEAVNQALSGEQPLAEIQILLAAAEQEYNTAQNALEVFIRDNQISVLEKKATEARTLFSTLADDRPWQISYYYQRKHAMEDLRIQAEALKQQLQNGTVSSAGNFGDALAVLIARANMLQINSSTFKFQPEIKLDLQSEGASNLLDSRSKYAADLDALVQRAQKEEDAAQDALNALADTVTQEVGYQEIEAVAAQIRELETQMEKEKVRSRELYSQRDLSWQAYQTLLQKEAELKNAAQTSNLVNLASPAVTPQKHVPRGTIRNTIIGGAAGGLISLFWIFGSQWWQSARLAREDEMPSSLPTRT